MPSNFGCCPRLDRDPKTADELQLRRAVWFRTEKGHTSLLSWYRNSHEIVHSTPQPTWRGHSALVAALHFCFSVRIHNCIFKRGRLKVEWFARVMLKTTPNFAHFDPVKIRGGWRRSLCQLLKLYPRMNLRNTFYGHSPRGCWARCIDKKRKFKGKA